MIARVALSGAVYSIDKLYDYLVPERLEADAAVGKRVSVPFAKGNRRQEGMVFALEEKSSFPRLKPIDLFLDEEPILDENILKLAGWIRQRYFCTYYDAVKAMLPAGIWLKADEVCSLVEPADKEKAYEAAVGDEAAEALLDMLYDLDGSCSAAAVRSALGAKASGAMEKLTEAGVLQQTVGLKKAVNDRTATLARLSVSAEEALAISQRKKKSAPQQAELLRLLSELGETGTK
jgi:primosomal protein N' (replication factor Y)